MTIEATRWGEGVRAVLVHGSISTGEECWQGQSPLADQGFELVVPDRRGYGRAEKSGADGEDFIRDAEDVAELLNGGAHLVGHSYGGLSALLAAARRPEAVLSLTVVEPPAFALAPDEPAVSEFVAEQQRLWARSELDDRAFLESFLLTVGAPPEKIPAEMLELWVERVGPLRGGRPVWEAEVPLEELAGSRFPKLVVSGGHHPAFDAVCDELTRGIGARRTVITGAGHEVQMNAEPFNAALLHHWRGVDQG